MSVLLVAAAIIVLFSVAVTSLLDRSKTLAASRIEVTFTESTSTRPASCYRGGCTAPVPAQTKSSSSSETSNMPPSTSIPPPFDMPRMETEATPAPQPTSEREAGVTAVETSHGSTRGPFIGQTSPAELSGSPEETAQPLIADQASAVQHNSGEPTPLLATSDQQPAQVQILQNFEIQRDDYSTFGQDDASLTTGSRFPEEPQMKKSASGSSIASPRSAALRHAASHRPSAVAADHNAARKLNRAELSRLLDLR